THIVTSLQTSSLSSPLPGPTYSAIPYVEVCVRLQRMEQQYQECLRQLAELRVQFNASKSDNKPATALEGNDIRATLKRLVMESIKPTESLRPGEPLGHDEVREQKDFPHIKFFTDRDWTEWKRDNKKTTRIGEEPVRGKKMSAQGLNHTAPYVEYTNGLPAEGDYINDARKFCRTFINLARSAQYPLTRKWHETDLWLQELFYTALRKKFTLFQLCHNNAKGSIFMYYTYYETVTRKWDKTSARTVNLNDAPHTISGLSDSEESESESARVGKKSVPVKSADHVATLKRPSGDDDAPTRPQKQARAGSDDQGPGGGMYIHHVSRICVSCLRLTMWHPRHA
ncbi:hypothetical protein BD310DRAFT_811020, partial [Dichomitus squalens]